MSVSGVSRLRGTYPQRIILDDVEEDPEVKRRGVIHVTREIGDPLAVPAEEIGFSDPDGLKKKPSERWPKTRTARRGVITLDRSGARMLRVGMSWGSPYVKVDSEFTVDMTKAEHGLFRVTKIEDLLAMRPAGGAHLFLEEVLPTPQDRLDTTHLTLSDTAEDLAAALAAADEAEWIEMNAELGDLEDLV